MDYNVFPLFPSIIFQSTVNEDHEDTFNQLKQLNFFENTHSKNCFYSSKFDVLNEHIDLKNSIIDKFNVFKTKVLCYYDTNFQITTSWVTKVLENTSSHFHNHKNCFYSGVLYFDGIDNSAPIEFSDENLKPQSFLVEAKSENLYNNNYWRYFPKKNDIIFFPSYLNHRVGLHNSNIPRYSLAFNIIPVGPVGYADSFININFTA